MLISAMNSLPLGSCLHFDPTSTRRRSAGLRTRFGEVESCSERGKDLTERHVNAGGA